VYIVSVHQLLNSTIYIYASSENQEPQYVVHSRDFLAEEKIQTNDRIPGTDLCLNALSVLCILLQ